jgi:predicted phosphate transport protein (TIGR00153 family)
MRLIPRETRFYDLFAASASHLPTAAALLLEIVDSPPAQRVGLAERLADVEHAGDDATHEIMRALNTSFISPFDREDIAQLAGRLDDVLDFMEAAGDLTVLYRIVDLPAGVREQVNLLAEAARLTVEAMPRLRTLRDLDSYWITINEIENRADSCYRALLANLFNANDMADLADLVTMIKIKEVVDQLEAAADAFEDVANVIQSIAAKES